jgi:hypothetical protein
MSASIRSAFDIDRISRGEGWNCDSAAGTQKRPSQPKSDSSPCIRKAYRVLHLSTHGAGQTDVLNGCHFVLIRANAIRAQQLAGTADEAYEGT